MAKIETSSNVNPRDKALAPVESFTAEGLACQRGGRIVVPALTFEVQAGHALLLRGPNGSGKTTLLRTLAGFLPPAAGQIKVKSREEVTSDRACFHYIGHTNGIKPRLSVFENASFWQRYYGAPADTGAAGDALDAFGLLGLASFSAGHLSQGQARRLGLARLLAAPRPVWLLDEPSVSLDTRSVGLLEKAIGRHLDEGGLAIVSTHIDLALPQAAILDLGVTAWMQ